MFFHRFFGKQILKIGFFQNNFRHFLLPCTGNKLKQDLLIAMASQKFISFLDTTYYLLGEKFSLKFYAKESWKIETFWSSENVCLIEIFYLGTKFLFYSISVKLYSWTPIHEIVGFCFGGNVQCFFMQKKLKIEIFEKVLYNLKTFTLDGLLESIHKLQKSNKRPSSTAFYRLAAIIENRTFRLVSQLKKLESRAFASSLDFSSSIKVLRPIGQACKHTRFSAWITKWLHYFVYYIVVEVKKLVLEIAVRERDNRQFFWNFQVLLFFSAEAVILWNHRIFCFFKQQGSTFF